MRPRNDDDDLMGITRSVNHLTNEAWDLIGVSFAVGSKGEMAHNNFKILDRCP